MPSITIILGGLLIVLGVGSYLRIAGTDDASITALIPAFFGIPIAVLGGAALAWPARRGPVMHVAVVLALLGFLGAGRGLLSLPTLLSDPDAVARPLAVIVQSIMAVACLVYLVLAIASFVRARRSAT